MNDTTAATLGEAIVRSSGGAMFVGVFVAPFVFALANSCRGYYFMIVHRGVMCRRMLGDRSVAQPPFRMVVNVFRFPVVRRAYLCTLWFIGTVIMNTEYWEVRHTPLPRVAAAALPVLCALLTVDVLATSLWQRSREHRVG